STSSLSNSYYLKDSCALINMFTQIPSMNTGVYGPTGIASKWISRPLEISVIIRATRFLVYRILRSTTLLLH
ncbi:hypothetical protein PMAYCL1PPCAC_22087, partial [Pristionchus mayeri]